jgi:hypothetical protein
LEDRKAAEAETDCKDLKDDDPEDAAFENLKEGPEKSTS